MRKILKTLLGKSKQSKPIILTIRNSKGIQQYLQCNVGDNLMDVTNKTVNQNINVFGLCDKQLACTTCSVEIQTHFDKLTPPSEDQLDILYNLPGYKDKCTRMACQIKITQQLNGMIVRIPPKNSAFST